MKKRNRRASGELGGTGRVWALLCAAFVLGICWSTPAQAGQDPATETTQTAEARVEESPAPQGPARISGRIVDPAGMGVAAASVKLTSNAEPAGRDTTSDADGYFFFATTAPGPFHLTISLTGFATQEFSGDAQPAENVTVPRITLALASIVTEVRVTPPTFEIAQEQIKEQEKQKALGIVPNYYVSYIPNAAPLAPRQKFELAWKTMLDPMTFGITGAIAGIQQAGNEFSGYGQGTQGYAKRYGAAYADSAIATLIGGAVLPSLLKQDPRYFYKGTGSKKSRLWYAVSRAVITKGDNGHWQPDYSGLLGGLAAGGISNLYYPAQDRDLNVTFENWAIGVGASAAANVLQEFVVKRLTPSAANRDPNRDSNGGVSKPHSAISKAFGLLIHEGD